MTRLVSRAEGWERAYEAFKNVNFAAFDFNTIKQSMFEYIKLYFPETFNDYIETSEFVAIIEVFAYVAELMAYRLDVNAHENFLPTAQLKENVLRLAKFISYAASRNLPARGMVKITSVSTTERVFDANGIDLANTVVRWNDNNNQNWKNQFLQILNRVMEQPFGSVSPNGRFQIENILFELYTLNWIPPNLGVFSYQAQTTGGVNAPMELVPVVHTDEEGIFEKRPENNPIFSFLYGSDGLGDSSDYTGFFMYTKQGVLQRYTAVFDGVTPNQTYNVPTTNINQTDVWLNQIDPDTGETVNDILPILSRPSGGIRTGEWVQVDTTKTQNVIFNTIKETNNKYEVETLTDDGAKLIFGDGEFANIPDGTFNIWCRVSANQDLVIPQSSVVEKSASFTYFDLYNRVQTLTFTFTLVNSLLNASSSETIEHIRQTAPGVYSTQDRMVNHKDYNMFMLQDPSILRLRSLNRTFAGDSRYIQWSDPSGEYENVKIFGDDLIVYTQDQVFSTIGVSDDIDVLITTAIQPLLSSPDVFLHLVTNGIPPTSVRRIFNQDEVSRLTTALTPPPLPVAVNMYFNKINFEWYSVKTFQTPDVSQTFAIVDVNTVTEIFAVNGDQTALFTPGKTFVVANSTANDGGWTTLSSTFNTISQQTEITVTGNIVDATADGDITVVQYTYPDDFLVAPVFVITQTSIFESEYEIERLGTRITMESPTTQFWNTNQGETVINYDTLNSDYDTITILKANVDADRKQLLSQNWMFNILGQDLVEIGLPDAGLPDIHKVNVIPVDADEDRVPDNPAMIEIINPRLYEDTTEEYEITVPLLGPGASVTYSFTLPTDLYGLVDLSASDILTLNPLGTFDLNIVKDPITSAVEFSAVLRDGASIVFNMPLITGRMFNNFDLTILNPSATFSVPSFTFHVDFREHVYFTRFSEADPWVFVPATFDNLDQYVEFNITRNSEIAACLLVNPGDVEFCEGQFPVLWKRENGRAGLNFAWFHFTPYYHLTDPAPTNIIDTFIITKGYYDEIRRWLQDQSLPMPVPPKPVDLRNSFNYLLVNKMISDTVILKPGNIKLLFGQRAQPELRARLLIVKTENPTLTDNQIKATIVTIVRNFFNVLYWEFGESFFFTELAAAIHAQLQTEIRSVVLVPTFATTQFGDLFEIRAREDEVLQPDISVGDIDIVTSYNEVNLRLNG